MKCRAASLDWLRYLTLFSALVILTGCSADWPAYRHNILRTAAQLNQSALSDPQKVSTLHIGWTFPPPGLPGVAPTAFRSSPVVYNGVVFLGNSNGYFY